ncbi:MAG: hypothetical protein K2O24_00845 [Muribaculaceae bacterium]|nr:hypothetical protein [Muribaculaceae bacterium]
MGQGKLVYFNDPQRLVQLVGARKTVVVAGRRTGKTDSIAAPYALRCMQRMPGSTGGIVVPTFRHGLTNTIPGLLAAWRRWGYMEGVHFVVGRRPPQHFAQPVIKPDCWERVISFVNGSIAVLVSQDVVAAANSLTLAWLLIDEARFVDYDKLKEETLPALGGIRNTWGSCSLWGAMMILSDMPQSKRGSWFLSAREDQDPQLIETIGGCVAEIHNLRRLYSRAASMGRTPPDYIPPKIKALDRKLNQLRSVATLYREYSSIENIQLLGEDYIRRMKRDLTPKTFQTSILCRRLGLQKDGFYSSLGQRHLYDADSQEFLERMWRDADWSAVTPEISGASPVMTGDSPLFTSRADADVVASMPLYIGMDYNANINWMVIGQPVGSRLNVLRSFYVKYERRIPSLVSDVCTYYSDHPTKRVIYYFDHTAIGNNYAVSDRDFMHAVSESFAAHGWQCDCVYIGQAMKHHEKYLLINEGFAGRNRLTPYFNRAANDALLTGIRSAGIKIGRNGWEKDKDGEKKPETEEDLLEHRTDGTDAFDTLYIGCERFPQEGGAMFISMSVE